MTWMVLEGSDRELIEGCRRGERDAFRALFETYAADTGHTIVYFKNASGTITSLLSFGPGDGGVGPTNVTQFLHGTLPGDAHWPIQDALSTWESYISQDQLSSGEQAIKAFKAHVPNYTMQFNCTSASISIATRVGLSLPDGVGQTMYRLRSGITLHRDTVANPYTFNVQMAARFGAPGHASAASFPKP